MKYSKNQNTKKSKYKKIVVVLLALIFTGLLGLYVYSLNKPDVVVDNNGETEKINYGPPTDEEKQAGNEQKSEISENTDLESSEPQKNNAEVVIVDSSQYEQEIEVRAFVANVVKDGECTITFTKASESISKTVPAYADAASTPCITLTVSRSEFKTDGEWGVRVVYSNSTDSGSADSKVVIK